MYQSHSHRIDLNQTNNTVGDIDGFDTHDMRCMQGSVYVSIRIIKWRVRANVIDEVGDRLKCGKGEVKYISALCSAVAQLSV